MTAVMRLAEAPLHAEIKIRSSIKLSLTSLQPDWMIKTSSSRTDSEILTSISPLEKFLTVHGVKGTLSLPVLGLVNHPVWATTRAASR